MVDLNVPLDLSDPDASEFIGGIQGNILKGHARDHATHILIRFKDDLNASRIWVRDFGGQFVTSAQAQQQQIQTFKVLGDGKTFANFALSSSGYAALGLKRIPADERFKLGMKNSGDLKGTDPPPSTWEQSYQGDLHALVILADQKEDRLASATAKVTDSLTAIAELIHVERGDRIVKKDPRAGDLTLVHFGFADGISQPLAIRQDIDTEVARRGRSHWDPGAPLRLLLSRDPSGGWGSYLVFRKLEQDVAGFLKAEAALVAKLGLGGNPKLVEAFLVGRYRDGYPSISAQPEPDGSPGNDFDFDNDRFGAVCPYQAHIRKTNPRGDLNSIGAGRPALSLDRERAFRIGRRGIPYGSADYISGGAAPPSGGVGLLFVSVQSDLQNFEILQAGSDSSDFATVGVGVDATIGRSSEPTPQKWIAPIDGSSTASDAEVRFTFANFVTLRGGEYFFLPGMTFFERLLATERA
jgi:deferrochelatase/peroxidase EfeB